MAGSCEETRSVVTSDQPFFDPGTSTSGLSSGVTVGGTGSSLGQTIGEATQRVTGSRVVPVPECTSFKSSADNRFTCTENYRFRSVASPGVLPVLECASFKSSADNRFPCTENYRFRSVTGSGVLPVPQCTSLKPTSDNRFTCYRESPVPECCWFRSLAGYKDLMVTSWLDRKFLQKNSFNQPATEPTDWVPAYTTFSDSCFKELEILVK